jgi:hypothetical protein
VILYTPFQRLTWCQDGACWCQLVGVGAGWYRLCHGLGLVQGEQELEGLVILDRLTRKGPGAGRDQEREGTRSRRYVAIGIARA